MAIIAIEMDSSAATQAKGSFADEIGAELESLGLGSLDCSRWKGEIVRFFYRVPEARLAQAIEHIRQALGKRELLETARLGRVSSGGSGSS